MKNETKAIIYVIFAVLLWGTVPVISKITLKSLDFFQFTAYSLFFSLIFMLFIIFFQKKITMFREYNPKDYTIMILMGIFGVFLPYLLYFGGINFASPADAQILNNTWQIFAIIFAFFLLKEEITSKKIIALTLGFIGTCLIFYQGISMGITSLYFVGLILALGSAVVDSLFYIIGKKLSFETWFSLTIYYFFAFISALIFIFLFSKFVILSFKDLIGVIYIGIFGIALPVTFMFKALKLRETSKIMSISYLSPFLSLVFIYLFLKSKIYFLQIIGLLIIVLGIIISQKANK